MFGKVGHVSSEVITQLLNSKCLPALYYGLDACPLNRDQVRSLDFFIKRSTDHVAPSDIIY